MNVVDFTSALYLDLRHPSRCLAPWQRLTTGVPAALAEAPAVAALSAGLARLLGRPAATPARSSLHALVDVVGALGDGATVWCDSGAYPIAGWAARAAGHVPRRFAHHDPTDLARQLADLARSAPGRPAALNQPAAPDQPAALNQPPDPDRPAASNQPLAAGLARPGAPDQPLADDLAWPWGAGLADPAQSLAVGLRRQPAAGGGRPLVLCDGYCPGCGRVAPIDEYLRVVRQAGGLVIVDDTQAVGVLGRPGGAGTPAWLGISGPGLVTVASLAKGLGVPMAVVGGDPHVIARIRARGPARQHGSAPSAADLAATAYALKCNAAEGDRRRERLTTSVRRLRSTLAARGIRLTGGLFPVQSTPAGSPAAAAALTSALLRRGVRAVAHRPQCRPGTAAVSLLITAAHTTADIDRAATALAAELPAVRNGHSGLLAGVRS
ncbi:aminotransferase class I/II-fold pyridoxal phosphate-dependent enzyme [Actinoplanes sp. L3-i22]|uniref:aminotransferase class I/II-fold pyridoxal phosphate-dependent enzyme n=1 Tax=Actinoplanes sp. L3-i22 TaxID=2836373 RepID=UPI001C780766|nr:aminotransferase class I/II-fold pyridoxal phosphate-dependent enzyme [Actinoplanes sp. L3-i22]BCY07371.1 hypothetical protein L3i22_024590 [Actinoplanes sp. L3-i22]